jgi:tetratricopeptide (TPR) repeat protein
MKKIAIIMLLALPVATFAQKEAKPNINKAIASLRAGKFEEAKSIIDAATTYEKTQGDGKTWFYRGVIYAALDTTTSYKGSEDLVKISGESFKKAEELAKGKASTYFLSDPRGGMLLYDQAKMTISQNFLVKGDKYYNEEDYSSALKEFEKGLTFDADTTFYQYAGYAAYSGDERPKAIEYLTEYIRLGGRSLQAMTIPVLLLYEEQAYEKSLESAREFMKIVPDNKTMKEVELNSLIQLQRYSDAASTLEESIKANPNDVQSHYLLGVLNSELKKSAEAKKNFEDALKVDPNHFESGIALARIYYFDAKEIKDQMNALGISAADKKKRLELDVKYVEKLKIALPYWQKLEKLNPDSTDVIDGLYTIQGDLDNQAELKRLEKRYKDLGIID